MIDARPSDAIALALRADCPIYVAEQVMQSAKLNTRPSRWTHRRSAPRLARRPERRRPWPLQNVARPLGKGIPHPSGT